ncbi:MAG TPA: LPS export ABC transporter ATP-binding protein [Trueperaceae bacterium]|nr:LPS export ABC transporter ATP-binding protein [Trueperaceae bacterium]
MGALNSVPDGAAGPAAATHHHLGHAGTSGSGETKVLSARGLSKRYGRRNVVDALDLDLRRGEIVALLGPNGAGKTTSFYMIVGFVRPNTGAIRLAGQDVTRWPMHRRARLGLGYLAQEPSAFRRMSVRDNLMAILEFQGLAKKEQDRRADALLDEFHISHLAHHRADTLSGGERRRLEIARSLTIDPDFLLLDEPFTGVDPKSIREIQTLIHDLRARRGLGVLLTDHSVRETLAIADRVVLMFDGRVRFDGTPDAFAADPEVRNSYLGSDFQL